MVKNFKGIVYLSEEDYNQKKTNNELDDSTIYATPDDTQATDVGIGIETYQYDNTTLAEHLDEILNFTNPLNGGTLLFIGFRLESDLQGTMTAILTDTSTGQLYRSDTQSTILPADNFTIFRPASIYPDNGTTQQVKFNTTEVNTIGFGNLSLGRAGGVQSAILSGLGYVIDSTTLGQYSCSGVSILNARLRHLTIECQKSN